MHEAPQNALPARNGRVCSILVRYLSVTRGAAHQYQRDVRERKAWLLTLLTGKQRKDRTFLCSPSAVIGPCAGASSCQKRFCIRPSCTWACSPTSSTITPVRVK